MNIGILVVIVIVLIYWYFTLRAESFDDYLYGFWLADQDEFCESTGIKSMFIFVGDKGAQGDRPGHIIISDDMSNQSFVLRATPGWCTLTSRKNTMRANIAFDDEQIWPADVMIDVNMSTGEMKIHSDGVLYAQVLKQHDVTNAARASAEADSMLNAGEA